MSKFQSRNPKGPLPSHWLHCPRKASELIQNTFLALKTPLSSDFDNQIPRELRFTPKMLFASLKEENMKMGLLIDLTNTSRYYDRGDVEAHGCQYLKLSCRGHDEAPSIDQVRTFINICREFIVKHPLEAIGIHCTHGFNRTGFLISSYLIEMQNFNVNAALALFASVRHPGIYKDYLRELYCRYDNVKNAPAPPETPAWCLELDNHHVKNRNQNSRHRITRFHPIIPGIPVRSYQYNNSHGSDRNSCHQMARYIPTFTGRPVQGQEDQGRDPGHQMPRCGPVFPRQPSRSQEYNNHRFENRNGDSGHQMPRCGPVFPRQPARSREYTNHHTEDRNVRLQIRYPPRILPERPLCSREYDNHRFGDIRARDSGHQSTRYPPVPLKRPAMFMEYNNYHVDNRQRDSRYHFSRYENPGEHPVKRCKREFSSSPAFIADDRKRRIFPPARGDL